MRTLFSLPSAPLPHSSLLAQIVLEKLQTFMIQLLETAQLRAMLAERAVVLLDDLEGAVNPYFGSKSSDMLSHDARARKIAEEIRAKKELGEKKKLEVEVAVLTVQVQELTSKLAERERAVGESVEGEEGKAEKEAESTDGDSAEEASDICGSCSATEALNLCTLCRKVSYCNAACQRKAWKRHKKDCRATAAAAATAAATAATRVRAKNDPSGPANKELEQLRADNARLQRERAEQAEALENAHELNEKLVLKHAAAISANEHLAAASTAVATATVIATATATATATDGVEEKEHGEDGEEEGETPQREQREVPSNKHAATAFASAPIAPTSPTKKVRSRTCHVCSSISEETMMACARCGGVRYCSLACQRTDWPDHKAACREKAKKLREAETVAAPAVMQSEEKGEESAGSPSGTDEYDEETELARVLAMSINEQ